MRGVPQFVLRLIFGFSHKFRPSNIGFKYEVPYGSTEPSNIEFCYNELITCKHLFIRSIHIAKKYQKVKETGSRNKSTLIPSVDCLKSKLPGLRAPSKSEQANFLNQIDKFQILSLYPILLTKHLKHILSVPWVFDEVHLKDILIC